MFMLVNILYKCLAVPFVENYMCKPVPNWKNGCEKKLKTIAFLGTTISMINTILIMKNPERAYFLTSLHENPKATSFLKKLPLILCQMWVWGSLWAHLYYYCFFLLPYNYTALFLLRQLKYAQRICQLKILKIELT